MTMITYEWLCDNDKFMNNSWISGWYMHDALIK